MKHKIIVFLAITLSQIAFSSSIFALNQIGYHEVKRLYVWTNGEAHVWVTNAGKQTCSDQTYPTRYILKVGAKGFDHKFSLLLSARSTGEGVSMNYSCINGKPYINAIRY